MKKLFLVGLLSAMLISPAQAFFRAKAETVVDDFDGSTMVKITHGGLDCSRTTLCPMIGFAWSSKIPNELLIDTQMYDPFTRQYFNIERLEISVDGNIQSFEGVGTTSLNHDSIATYSKQGFFVPIELLDVFKTNKNIKIRLVTDKGYYHGSFTGGARQSIAEKHFILFNNELAKQQLQ